MSNTAVSQYLGYFLSEHGDQWLFLYDRISRRATLRSGDLHWDRPLAIASLDELPPSLTESERHWIEACWQAATFS